MHNTIKTQALNRMILTHFLNDEISETLRFQLKLIEEETDALKMNWTRLSHLYHNLNSAYNIGLQGAIVESKTRLFDEVRHDFPLVYGLIMLDVFG